MSSLINFACPRQSLDKVYVPYNRFCQWDYYNHETIKLWREREKEDDALRQIANEIFASVAAIALVEPTKASAVPLVVAGGAACFVNVIKQQAKNWLQKSEDNGYCEVRLNYCVYAGIPILMGYEAQ